MKFSVRARCDGSIGIPIAFRYRLGILPGTVVHITTDNQGRIYLKPEKSTCLCCHEESKTISLITGMCPACEELVQFHVHDGGDSLKQAIIKARKTGRDDRH